MPTVQDFFETPVPPGGGGGSHPLADPQATEWEKTYATFEHLSLLSLHVLLPVLPALIMWLVKRDRSPFVDDHGKEAVNFQISLLLYWFIGLCTIKLCGLGIAVIIATYVLGIVGMIMGAMAASRGRYFRYPACLRIVH